MKSLLNYSKKSSLKISLKSTFFSKKNYTSGKRASLPKTSQTNRDFKTLFLLIFFAVLGISAFAIDDNLSNFVNETFENISKNLSLDNLTSVLLNISNFINETVNNSNQDSNNNQTINLQLFNQSINLTQSDNLSYPINITNISNILNQTNVDGTNISNILNQTTQDNTSTNSGSGSSGNENGNNENINTPLNVTTLNVTISNVTTNITSNISTNVSNNLTINLTNQTIDNLTNFDFVQLNEFDVTPQHSNHTDGNGNRTILNTTS
ncbi:MAG: hypothetical protein HRU03_09210, partial [Nanoarchaeales archaeon]|nr:hypothetical protein [Nanoarchaeales archaeon]